MHYFWQVLGLHFFRIKNIENSLNYAVFFHFFSFLSLYKKSPIKTPLVAASFSAFFKKYFLAEF